MADDLPREVRQLIDSYLPSMDHVEVLLRVHAAPDAVHTPEQIAALLRVEENITRKVFKDLEDAHLLVRRDGGYAYAPGVTERAAIGRLADMYNSRPVTLVRAIYARPATAVKSFADAFRLR